MQRVHPFLVLIATILIPVVGYCIMQMLVYIMPVEGGGMAAVIFTLALIALGLAVPYWMLKTGAHYAHLRNSEERELHLADLPKDKGDL